MNAPVSPSSRSGGKRGSMIFAGVAAVLSLGLAVLTVQSALGGKERQARQAIADLTQPKGDIERGRTTARRLLRASPLDPSLLRSLAFAADRTGAKDDTYRLMKAAGGLTWRDTPTNAWLFQHNLETGDYVGAARRADALLRTRPDLAETLFPVLAKAVEDPRTAKAVADRLSREPLWRIGFLAKVNANERPEVTFALLSNLLATPAPPTESEASRYVGKLVTLGRYDEALLSQILFLPKERLDGLGYLFNGDFNEIQGITPFDWATGQTSGASLSMEPSPSRPNDRALHVLHDGVSRGTLISQLLVLPPGSYRLVGETSSSTPQTAERLNWKLQCPTGAPIMTATPKVSEAWTRFSAAFEVPAGCGALEFRLEPGEGERRTTIDVWYDKLAIEAAGA